MKKIIAMSALALAVSFGATSCKKKVSDADLTTQAVTTVSSNSAATVTVKDGVAHLEGTFPDQASKDKAIADLKAIPGIKDVMDMATVAPVVVETTTTADPAVLQKVKDAVKDIPAVKVETVNGELTLTGNVTKDEAKKIKQSVDALKVGTVHYNYIVK